MTDMLLIPKSLLEKARQLAEDVDAFALSSELDIYLHPDNPASEGLDADALVEAVARAMRTSPYYENDGSDPITLDVDCEVNFNGLARAALSAIRPTLDAERVAWEGEVADWLENEHRLSCRFGPYFAVAIRSGAYRSDERG